MAAKTPAAKKEKDCSGESNTRTISSSSLSPFDVDVESAPSEVPDGAR